MASPQGLPKRVLKPSANVLMCSNALWFTTLIYHSGVDIPHHYLRLHAVGKSLSEKKLLRINSFRPRMNRIDILWGQRTIFLRRLCLLLFMQKGWTVRVSEEQIHFKSHFISYIQYLLMFIKIRTL